MFPEHRLCACGFGTRQTRLWASEAMLHLSLSLTLFICEMGTTPAPPLKAVHRGKGDNAAMKCPKQRLVCSKCCIKRRRSLITIIARFVVCCLGGSVSITSDCTRLWLALAGALSHCSFTLGPQASHTTSLSLGFLICKMGKKTNPIYPGLVSHPVS